LLIKHYLNLTNGLEWDVPDPHYIRIPSTALEKNDWFSVFVELDHDLVFNLALGNTCIIYDCGCRRITSKVIASAVPTIKDCLQAFWFNGPQPKIYQGLFSYKEKTNFAHIKRKYGYYKRYLKLNHDREVKLIGHSKYTSRDGDRQFYEEKITSSQKGLPQPKTLT
jgi:hypothetical protein